ncbi:SPOR domain-containing protein [Paramicrobacterium sp. CJ85]|uniref:SPOR domain-containing protein n=1 Tax=Paramicrobacterium sp. CJ85 TaxID=3445355 RepID=UPI003F5DF455
MADDPSEQFWYNLKTGGVERGFLSPSSDRVGPFDTADEASHALELLRENSRKWAEEEQADE